MIDELEPMKIKTFSERYRSDVIALWEACNLTRPWNDPNKDIDRKLTFQPDLFFVGIIEDRVAASAMAGYDGHRGSVYYLAIDPSLQGLGYGQQMMAHIETVLTTLGCPKINLAVRSGNDKVLGFYDRLSYNIEEVASLGKRLIADD